MEKALYQGLKSQILQYMPEVKYVALWNNQFNRANGKGKEGSKEHAFGYPCVFIEFAENTYSQLSLGVQEFTTEVITHLGVKSFITDDDAFLDLKEKLFFVCERFQIAGNQGSFSRLSRVKDEFNYDHDDINEVKTQYHVYGKDFYRYIYGYQPTPITGVTLSAVTSITSAATQDNSTWFENPPDWSNDNGTNTFNPTLSPNVDINGYCPPTPGGF